MLVFRGVQGKKLIKKPTTEPREFHNSVEKMGQATRIENKNKMLDAAHL